MESNIPIYFEIHIGLKTITLVLFEVNIQTSNIIHVKESRKNDKIIFMQTM